MEPEQLMVLYCSEVCRTSDSDYSNVRNAWEVIWNMELLRSLCYLFLETFDWPITVAYRKVSHRCVDLLWTTATSLQDIEIYPTAIQA
jgi:hypothetical protein